MATEIVILMVVAILLCLELFASGASHESNFREVNVSPFPVM